MEPVLSVQDLSKQFGTYTALDRVSLDIPRGSIFGLLGPNGAGKTTLIRIINQITYPDSGSIWLDGQPLGPEHIAQIGYLPEERGLYKSMKVGEQALYLAQLKGLSRADAREQLRYWFDKLDIGHWWNKKVQELSKGMAQKIQFVVTVLHRPKLLIFDEPFSGFDPINAALIKDQILELNAQGASIIFSTHRMESVEELCQHIGLIHRSRLILKGRLSAIKKEYRQGKYKVQWEPANREAGLGPLQEALEVSAATFDAEEGIWDFTLKLGDADKAAALQLLSAHGNLAAFSEWIPTAEEIFIRTVQKQEANG